MSILFDWYAQQGIRNIGEEGDSDEAPVGYRELVDVLARVARRFQEEGYWQKRLGRPIPILIHDLEYIPCVMQATAYANPNGEAGDFLAGWEDSDDDCPDEELGDELRAIMGSITANIHNKAFMDRLLGIKEEPDDKDVEDLMKLIFGE